MKFITIKASHEVTDLVVTKSRLESEGIQCRLKNEMSTQVMNFVPDFVVELQVPDFEMERVKKIMRETGEIE